MLVMIMMISGLPEVRVRVTGTGSGRGISAGAAVTGGDFRVSQAWWPINLNLPENSGFAG